MKTSGIDSLWISSSLYINKFHTIHISWVSFLFNIIVETSSKDICQPVLLIFRTLKSIWISSYHRVKFQSLKCYKLDLFARIEIWYYTAVQRTYTSIDMIILILWFNVKLYVLNYWIFFTLMLFGLWINLFIVWKMRRMTNWL